MQIKKKTAVICFFMTSKGGHGTAEVSLGLYKSIQGNKRLFEFKENKKINNNFLLINIKKIFFLFKVILRLRKYFHNNKSNIIFIEGASWIGFSFLFIILSRIFLNKVFIVYHAHNIEYEIRQKKNNLLIAYLSKIFEKFVYDKSDIATSVSKYDKKKIKKLYNLDSSIFMNGVHSSRLKIEKINSNIPRKFYLYSGSYLYHPNKVALDDLIKNIYPQLIKKYPNLYLVITGEGLPAKLIKNKKILYYKFLQKKNLNYLIKKAKFLLLPLKNAPGTKLKVIEALLIGTQIITTKHGIKGIEIKNLHQPYVYKNQKDLFKYIDISLNTNKSKNLLINSSKFYKKKFLIENIFKKLEAKYLN